MSRFSRTWLPGILALVPDTVDINPKLETEISLGASTVRLRQLLVPKPSYWVVDEEKETASKETPKTWLPGAVHPPPTLVQQIVALFGNTPGSPWRGLHVYLVHMAESEWTKKIPEIAQAAFQAGEHFPAPLIVLVLTAEKPGYKEAIATYLPKAEIVFTEKTDPEGLAQTISQALNSLSEERKK